MTSLTASGGKIVDLHVSSRCALCLGCLASFFDAWRFLVVCDRSPPTNGRRVFYVSRLPLVWILRSSARACESIYCERQTRPDGRKRPPPGVFVALPFLPDDDCSGLTQKAQKKREKAQPTKKNTTFPLIKSLQAAKI